MARLSCCVAALPNIRSWGYSVKIQWEVRLVLLQKCVSTELQTVDPTHRGVTPLKLRAKTNLSLYKLIVLGSYLQWKTNQHRGQIDFSGFVILPCKCSKFPHQVVSHFKNDSTHGWAWCAHACPQMHMDSSEGKRNRRLLKRGRVLNPLVLLGHLDQYT